MTKKIEFNPVKESGISTSLYDPSENNDLVNFYSRFPMENKQYEILKGKVIGMIDNGALLDLGLKSDAFIPSSEFRDIPKLALGDEVEVYVEKQENAKDEIVVSRKKAKVMQGWRVIQNSLDNNTVVTGIVKRRTKGGLIVDVSGVEAFLPGSQVDIKPVADFDAYLGKEIDLIVIKVNPITENAIVSHKAFIEKDIASQRSEIISRLEKGQVLEGIVKNITSFGAFINTGGLDGLLHITDISWNKINHPSDILSINQKVKVVVLDFDEEKGRIALGMKQLTPHPWHSLPDTIKVGAKVKGSVVRIEDYGAFVEIGGGVEGLLHASELSWSQYMRDVNEFVKLGDEIEVAVIFMDREERKLALGLKQLTPNPWDAEDFRNKYSIGTKHTATVKNIVGYGAFVELAPGVDALLHISDLSWIKKIHHPSEVLKLNQEIDVMILDINVPIKKISVGLKQVEEDPWDNFEEIFSNGSTHKGKVITITPRHAIVELIYGVEGYVAANDIVKQDKTKPKVGDELDFQVIKFLKNERKIILSHVATYSSSKPYYSNSEKNNNNKNRFKDFVDNGKTTLGDLGVLNDLKSASDNSNTDKK
jgi:small subunit ribosomal protein S1